MATGWSGRGWLPVSQSDWPGWVLKRSRNVMFIVAVLLAAGGIGRKPAQ